MDLNKRLEELKPYQLNCNVFDVYSYNGLSMQDLLCQFFTKINECVDVSNGTLDLTQWLVNEGLSQEVVKKLMILLEDGTLENLINVNLFKSLNDKIDGLSTELETKANDTDLDVERKRIDNFTRLEEGSTSGDAELIDGRIGQDNIIYENLGSSMRNQFSKIVRLDNITDIGVEKFDKSIVENIIEYIEPYTFIFEQNMFNGGCYIKNGKLDYYKSSSDNNRFVIVDVKSGQSLKLDFRSRNTTNYHLIFADLNDNVISYHINDADKIYYDFEIDAPLGACKLGINSYAMTPVFKCGVLDSPLATQQYVYNKINEDKNPLTLLPNYYTNDYINSKILDINNNIDVESGLSFAFITDTHFANNSKNSKFLLKEILNKTNIPFVISGGDIVRSYGDEIAMNEDIDVLNDYINYIGKDKFFNLKGNHDFTIRTSSSDESGVTLNPIRTYSNLMRDWEFILECVNNKMYWQLINKTQKTKIIALDLYEDFKGTDVSWGNHPLIKQQQFEWLIENLTNVENYNIIIISHAPLDIEIEGYNGGFVGVVEMLKAMKNKTNYSYSNNWGEGVSISHDFSNCTNDLACTIAGHNHKDRSSTNNGFLSISTTCDACYNDDPTTVTRVKDTITEQAFDVFSIDTTKREIKAVRIGAGNNRYWSY